MNKIVAVLSFLLGVVLCGCSVDTSGYTEELTSSLWKVSLEGGAELVLSFDEEYACLSIENFNLKKEIKGKYIADEKSFVIFDTDVAQSYSFEYTPKGGNLDLTYNGSTITLSAE